MTTDDDLARLLRGEHRHQYTPAEQRRLIAAVWPTRREAAARRACQVLWWLRARRLGNWLDDWQTASWVTRAETGRHRAGYRPPRPKP